MSSFDDTELGFFEEPETLESPRRRRRRIAPRGGGPRRPSPPPPGAVALARLAGLVAIAIAVVLGIVFSVGACQGQSKHDEYASYLDDVQPIAKSSAGVGAAFANELSVASLTRNGFATKLEQWARLEQQQYAAAQRLRPPGPLQPAHQEVLAAIQLRAIGLSGLATTVSQAGSKPTATVASDLATQAQLLSASDIVWSELFQLPVTEELKAQGITGVIAPRSQFVTNPDVVSARSFAIVFGRLSSTTSGGKPTGLHGSALIGVEAVAGAQTLVLQTSSPSTVDVSSNLVFKVTVEDSGDSPEVKIPVTLSVVASGKKVYTKTHSIPQIVAKQKQTVSFSHVQLPPLAFGRTTSLVIDVGKVPGEVQLDNNKATYPVFFSLPTSG